MSDEPKFERHSLVVPCWCPMCQLSMRGAKSNQTFYNFGVCMNCFIEFIEGREQRWKDGWRPSPEQVASYLEKVS